MHVAVVIRKEADTHKEADTAKEADGFIGVDEWASCMCRVTHS